MSTSYVDYTIFSSDKFDPKQYGNSLLLSTIDRDELIIDFSSAENKIKFDLEEVETAVRQEIEFNWEDLLERTELGSSTTKDVSAIESDLKSLTDTYEKLSKKAVIPYETAEPLYDALMNLSSTTVLLRALKLYLDHFTRLEAAKDIIRTTEALVDLENIVREHQALMQLRIVIANIPRIDSKKNEVTRDCTLAITSFRNLGPSLAALMQLDRGQLMTALRNTINHSLNDASRDLKTGLEVNFTIKRLQATDSAKATTVFIQNLRDAFDEMGSIVNNLQKLEDDCPPELLQVILEDLCDHSASIKQYFWREVSGRISSLTRDAARSNPWVHKTLRDADIESIVSKGLQKGTMEYSVVYGSLSRRG